MRKLILLVATFVVLFSSLVFTIRPTMVMGANGDPDPTQTPTPTLTQPGTAMWLFDAQVTEVGKRAERARQFISWVLTHPSIDNHSVFRHVWRVSVTITLVLIILVVAIMGLGLIIAKKQDISLKVDVIPILTKAGLLILYAFFSYWLALGVIQITDFLMASFIKLLSGDQLFSIFFAPDPSGDAGYISFLGQRNFDPMVNESAKTSIFLIEFSSFTYFMMGIMLIIRKVILWFLLILSPFLALLLPFRFIRNIGWIWIGVFLQWAFYGPLFAIFLGALTKIWEAGIPFAFNFSRILSDTGVVYPLAINILYGGPQQVTNGQGQPLSHLSPVNTSSYIDTFAEYVISLIMLWVVLILPWWLLRIFRDYCCDGIYAMKNILLNMLGQQRAGPSDKPPSLSSQIGSQIKEQLRVPKQQYQKQEMKATQMFEKTEDIKTTKTEEISKKMNMSVSKLSDVARYETQPQEKAQADKVMRYMRNPLSAESKTEQTQFNHLKTELSERATKGDVQAKRLLEATTSSSMTIRDKIQVLAQEKPQLNPIVNSISVELKVPEDRVKHITTTMITQIGAQRATVEAIAANTQTNEAQVLNVIKSIAKVIDEETQTEAIKKTAEEAGVEKEKTKDVIKETAKEAEDEQLAKDVAEAENSTVEEVKEVTSKVFNSIIGTKEAAPPEPKTAVSIEEYEEMRKMWVQHYTKGEVPMSADVKDRQSWVEKERIKLDNVLNKLVSANEEVRAQGLQEVSDIIPFFILGDMSIQEVATYLRAKQMAAQEVAQNLRQESVLKDKLEEAQTEYVEVPAQVQEAKKEMKLEQKIEPEKKPEDKQEDKPEESTGEEENKQTTEVISPATHQEGETDLEDGN